MQNSKLLIGAHTSAAGGVENALYEGQTIGATTIQLFTSNQRRWDAKAITDPVKEKWDEAVQATHIEKVMSHDSYLINLGAANLEILAKSRHSFTLEIERCLKLGIAYLNFHPGAAVGETEESCIDRIVESLLACESQLESGKLRLLLEATAGQGSSIGWKFSHLGTILQKVGDKVPLGVCIDTCHIFAAGYDIRTPEAWEKTLNAFEEEVGLEHLYAFHLNDSLKGLGSRVDRHLPLGKGEIGWDAFRFLVTHPKTRHLPMYLETPGGPPVWKEEIAILKQMSEESI